MAKLFAHFSDEAHVCAYSERNLLNMGRAVSFSLPFRRRGLFFDDRRRRIVFSNDTNTPSQQYPIANTQ
jgi:hypothetical protein